MTVRTRYQVEVTKITEWTETVKENLVTERVPTGKKESDGYGRNEVVYHEKYQVVEVEKDKRYSQEILKQEVDTLDITAVIKAINGIT